MTTKQIFILLFISLFLSPLFSAQLIREYSTDDYPCRLDAEGNVSFGSPVLQGIPGAPNLPVERVSFLLPYNADLSTLDLSVANYSDRVISNDCKVGHYKVPDRPDNKNWEDANIYENNELYPFEEVKVISIGKMWEYKVVTIKFYPYQYNPVTRTLIKNDVVSFALNYDLLPLPPVVETAPASLIERMNKSLSGIVGIDSATLIDNSVLYPKAAASSVKETFVIMTDDQTSQMVGGLSSFIQFKESQGYNVVLATSSMWGGGTGDAAANNMRNWLRNNYELMNIKYLFIIGDPRTNSSVPMKMLKPAFDCPSDFFYSELSNANWNVDGDNDIAEYEDDFNSLNGPDFYGEISVGRYPLYGLTRGDIYQLNNYLNKVINYQTEFNTSWREKGLYAAPNSSTYGSNSSLQTNLIIESMKENLLNPISFNHERVYTFYDPELGMEAPHYNNSCTYDFITQHWSENAFGVFSWASHGRPTTAHGLIGPGIETGVITSEHVPLLNNNNPSIVFQGSCENGTPEVTNNLGFSLMNNGAIATVSATRTSYGWSDDGLMDLHLSDFSKSATMAGYNFSFNKKIIEERRTVGEAMLETKSRVYPITWENWSNCLMFSIYGDPSVALDDKANRTYTINASVKGADPVPYPQWTSGMICTGGDRVVYNGHIWEANWWVQAAPYVAQWGPWTDLGAYNSGNGSISSSGKITVDGNSSRTFTFTPDQFYQIKGVWVNGVSVGTPNSYTFDKVLSNKTIEVEFTEIY